MNNISKVKLAIVVGSTDWLPSEKAIERCHILVESFRERYEQDDIYECPICLTDNEVNVKRALRDVEKNDCNALCLYYANYGPESTGTLLASEFNGPVMLFAAAEEGEDSLYTRRGDGMSGFINACYALRLRNTTAYIPHSPVGTFQQCADMMHSFIKIARTMISVKDLKLISIGPRPSSYLASNAPNHLLYDLGIEVSEYSELELLNSYHKHEGDRRIDTIASEMASELGDIEVTDNLRNMAQYEATVEDWLRSHKGNKKNLSMTSTCWPAFPINFGFVPCYVNSRITGKGIPVSCEVDVYGAASEYIGQSISDDIVTILNINNNIPQTVYNEEIKGKEFSGKSYQISDLFLGYHCGTTSSCKLTSGRLEYHFVNRQLIGEENASGTIQGQIVPGEVTIFRLQGSREGALRAYVAQGQILPLSLETYGGYGVIAIPEMERFLRYVVLEKQFPNHCVVIFGHHGSDLIDVLRLLGVKEIYYNQPKEIPYEEENVLAHMEDWY